MLNKNIGRIFLAIVVVFGALFLFNTEAKADVLKKSNKSITIKSISLSSKKTIKVPDREAERNSYSRGGTLKVPKIANDVVSIAYQQLGKPYVWGSEGSQSFDCSGLVKYVYGRLGVALPHYTGYQVRYGRAIARSKLAPGDLVFFNTEGPISHVGIYIGNNCFIHAASNGSVITSSLYQSYYSSVYAGARRIF